MIFFSQILMLVKRKYFFKSIIEHQAIMQTIDMKIVMKN